MPNSSAVRVVITDTSQTEDNENDYVIRFHSDEVKSDFIDKNEGAHHPGGSIVSIIDSIDETSHVFDTAEAAVDHLGIRNFQPSNRVEALETEPVDERVRIRLSPVSPETQIASIVKDFRVNNIQSTSSGIITVTFEKNVTIDDAKTTLAEHGHDGEIEFL